MTRDATPAVEATLRGPALHADWERRYRTPAAEALAERLLDRILSVAGIPAGARVLDAGCGEAHNALRLARRGHPVVGVDLAPGVLKAGRARAATAGVGDRIELVEGNVLALPLADGEVDAALCWGVLMHVPQVEEAVAELARVLAPGARLIVSEANLWAPDSLRYLLPSPARRVRTPLGVESWRPTAAGPLVSRRTDIGRLQRMLARHGLTPRRRLAGAFTEAPAWLPPRGAARAGPALHRLNAVWFALHGPARGAAANIVVAERT